MIIENLPVKSTLKIDKGFDPYADMDDEEIDAYRDWMHWHMSRDFELLTMIPKTKGADFWTEDWKNSAFNTEDFSKSHPKKRFGYEHWKMKEILKRVDDLALMHSCISDREGRQNVLKRFTSILDNEFLSEANAAILAGNKRKASALHMKMRKCMAAWRRWNPRLVDSDDYDELDKDF